MIRLLIPNKKVLQFHELGFTADESELISKMIQRPQGLILVTGPTGSGKTQTLYTMLNALNKTEVNICSLEDPVEIKLNGINQIQIDERIGLGFSTVLRSLLRQDPDIIMIGEIRDTLTAELAIRAAQTGHLVLATLHTQNSIEAITRLKSLGINSDYLGSTLTFIIAQRLIRVFKDEILVGRTGLFELLAISPPLQKAILAEAPGETLYQLAKKEGYQTLYEAGMKKVNLNITTLLELNRVIYFTEPVNVPE